MSARPLGSFAAALLGAVVALALAPHLAPRATADADAAPPAPHRVAVCDVVLTTYDLAIARLEGSRYEEIEDELAELSELMEQADAAYDEYMEAEIDSPEEADAWARYERLSERVEDRRGPLVEEQRVILLDAIRDAHAATLSAVRAVAEERGFTHVFSTMNIEDPGRRETFLAWVSSAYTAAGADYVEYMDEFMIEYTVVSAAVTEDHVALAPEDADITPAVRDDLNLD